MILSSKGQTQGAGGARPLCPFFNPRPENCHSAAQQGIPLKYAAKVFLKTAVAVAGRPLASLRDDVPNWSTQLVFNLNEGISEHYHINFPSPVAQAMEFKPGEIKQND